MYRLLTALLFICSCTMSNNIYEQRLQKWIGQPEQELYSQWGTPSDVFYISDNRKIITFTRISKSGSENPYTNEINYNAISSSYETNNNAGPEYCRTSFTITNGIVSDFTFSGDYCVARPRI